MLRSPIQIGITIAPLLSVLLVVGCSALQINTPSEAASPGPELTSDVRNPASPQVAESPTLAADVSAPTFTDYSDADVPVSPQVTESPAPDASVPTFSDYPVADTFSGTPATVNLDSHPDAYTFRGQLWDGAAQGPNFAGHYTVVNWGCGTSCQAIAIVDAETGSVYMAPFSASVGVAYDLESELLIVNPVENVDEAFPPGFRPDWLKTEYYQWSNGDLVRVG